MDDENLESSSNPTVHAISLAVILLDTKPP